MLRIEHRGVRHLDVKRFVACAALIAGVMALMIDLAMAQGSRLRTRSSVAKQSMWLSSPDQLSQIRRLLQNDKAAEAVRVAEDFLANDMPGTFRYAGLNALCASLTAHGDIDRAIAACDKAIRMSPSRWEAINSRATAYYVAGRYEEAAQDFRRALEIDPDSELIQHNLRLVARYITESDL